MPTTVDDIIKKLLSNNSQGENLYSSFGGANSAQSNALQEMLKKAFDLEGIENARFDASKSFLDGEFEKSNIGFAEDNARQDRLMFSGAADQFGREATEGMRGLRSSLGARGVDPSSGTAAAMAGSLALRQSGQMMGAKRDITIDSLKRRDAQRQNRFRQAFGMAEFGNQSPSMLGLDALQDVTGVINENRAQILGTSESSKGRKNATKNAWIGGVGGLLGGLL